MLESGEDSISWREPSKRRGKLSLRDYADSLIKTFTSFLDHITDPR